MGKSVYSTRYQKLQALIAGARRSAGFSQAVLAIKLGRPQSFVSKYERGERRLDVVEFLDVCRALGVNPHDFLDRLDGRRSERGERD
jgi:transcriptional regulator with XRE-family HTH domain